MLQFDDPTNPSLTPPPFGPSTVVLGKLDSNGYSLHSFVTAATATAPNPWILMLAVLALGVGVAAAIYTLTAPNAELSKLKRPSTKIVVRLSTAVALVGIGVVLLIAGHSSPPPAHSTATTSTFTNWAEKRYGVKLSDAEATSLTAGVVTPVDEFGIRTEIHGAIDNGKLYLFGATGTELPLTAATTGIVSGE